MFTLILIISIYSSGVTSQSITGYKSYDECMNAVPKNKQGETIRAYGYCIPQPADKTKA